MARPRKPRIFKGPASHYATMPGEAIYEFSDGQSGGLISMRRHPDGNLLVQIYRTDDDVEVTTEGSRK